ncbi:MAG TPA: N-acetyl-gamma-glutamyl-phosphate reductase [Chondromyces sp.]|nr:N-acetyl-gamma-glutamyl-phosphate reductase [Chondromyces sp.]
MPPPEKGLKVAVLGASGYVGGELLRLLAGHPGVAGLRAMSQSRAGAPWAEVHPSLRNLPGTQRELEAADPGAAGVWADVVFLALPHGRSQQVLAAVEAGGPRLIVDTAADFRLADRALAEELYGPHERADALGAFAFGLADTAGEQLAGARRIAVPGCFATAALLALRTVASDLDADSDPVCFALTGSSGSGAAPKATTHHPSRAHNFFAYAVEGHRHQAELDQQLREWCGGAAPSCRLLTHSAPLVRGIHITLRARVRAPRAELLARARETFMGRPFVHLLERPPELAAVVGTNHAHLHVAAVDDGGEVLVFAVIDNLVKGAAGQAVQAMNLALGLDETAGLGFCGLAPC